MKVLFSSREGHFSLRWIRGVLAIRRRGLCVTLERSVENFFDEFAAGVLCNSNVCTTFAPVLKTLPRTKVVSRTRENDSVAQLVEQVTLNHWVVSSSLTGVTKRAGTTSQ